MEIICFNFNFPPLSKAFKDKCEQSRIRIVYIRNNLQSTQHLIPTGRIVDHFTVRCIENWGKYMCKEFPNIIIIEFNPDYTIEGLGTIIFKTKYKEKSN